MPCNNLNTYIYKDPLYCVCFLQKELPYCSFRNNVLNSFMHGNIILSANPKFISSFMKQSDYFDEEIFEKVSNKYCTPTEFINALSAKI